MQKEKRIPLYRPPVDDKTSEALIKCFQSGWWGYGEECVNLENRFKDSFGGWCIATSTCTSALYIAAKLLYKGDEDEVIIPAINWISAAMAFLESGFKVKIADVASANLMANLDTIKPLVTTKTTAILIVHLYGHRGHPYPRIPRK
jgi:dTDP-4-amino-4,6-dideoxygalactose transaminase